MMATRIVLLPSVPHVETLHPMGIAEENEEFTDVRGMSADVLSAKIVPILIFVNVFIFLNVRLSLGFDVHHLF